MGTAIAVILVKERRIANAFAQAGAVSPERAVPPDDLAIDVRGVGWRRLHAGAIVREAGEGTGRYYLDADAYAAVRRRRRRMVAVVLVVAAALMLGALFRTGM